MWVLLCFNKHYLRSITLYGFSLPLHVMTDWEMCREAAYDYIRIEDNIDINKRALNWIFRWADNLHSGGAHWWGTGLYGVKSLIWKTVIALIISILIKANSIYSLIWMCSTKFWIHCPAGNFGLNITICLSRLIHVCIVTQYLIGTFFKNIYLFIYVWMAIFVSHVLICSLIITVTRYSYF